jgi:hypothetical protein
MLLQSHAFPMHLSCLGAGEVLETNQKADWKVHRLEMLRLMSVLVLVLML